VSAAPTSSPELNHQRSPILAVASVQSRSATRCRQKIGYRNLAIPPFGGLVPFNSEFRSTPNVGQSKEATSLDEKRHKDAELRRHGYSIPPYDVMIVGYGLRVSTSRRPRETWESGCRRCLETTPGCVRNLWNRKGIVFSDHTVMTSPCGE